MRNRLFSVRHSLGFIVLAACLSPVGIAVQADPTPQTGAFAQDTTPTQTWEQRTRDLLRRLYIDAGGNPTTVDGLPLKTAAITVQSQFLFFGLTDNLTADELTQLERDALELAACAEWEPGPPDGTSYSLIVLLHDLGKTVHAAAVAY